MASKKEQNLTYLQRPVPYFRRKTRWNKRSWSGYNARQVIDTGMLSYESNISTADYPYISPAQDIEKFKVSGMEFDSKTQHMLGLYGFDDFLIFVYRSAVGKVKFYKIFKNANGTLSTSSQEIETDDVTSQRSVIQFNVYNSDENLVGSYDRRIIIFPDKLSTPYDGDLALAHIETDGNAIPSLQYATVHLSRVFGVDNSKVYASAFNDYSNWAVDTAEEYNEKNAWFSESQSNSKADGKFTGITAFQGHVVCFKKDFMHEIYNTKNPFRIQDIYAEGAIDNRTICDVDGNLFFCSEDGVKIYTGGNPRIISQNLGIDRFYNAVAGTDGRCYYLYCSSEKDIDENTEHNLFVYDTYCQCWSRAYAPDAIIGIASCNFGLFAMTAGGILYKLDSGNYTFSWSIETDLMTGQSCDIKHIDKLQLECEIDNVASFVISIEDANGGNTLIWSSEGREGHVIARVKLRSMASEGFKIRISGSGKVIIRAMELLIKQGGDKYV